ncbi:MAG TPA: CarD family transcriptional regulator, partial [Dehalococcoidia bacterium]|nr:CarD family transcriptional regulator [Dehalococcoidia bacterium]
MDLSRLLEPVDDSLGELPSRRGFRVRIGVGDAPKAAVLASMARRTDAAILIVVPKSARAGDLQEELGYWLGPEHARRLRLYPQRDILPYERASDDPWDTRSRLETIAWLSNQPAETEGDAAEIAVPPPIVIASVEAIAQRTLSPEAAHGAMSRLSIGDRIEPDDLLRRLQRSGYEIVSLVEAPGQAAHRGGIVDVFPPQAEAPVRIEFFGPDVDSLRLFDVDTQRSRDKTGSVDLGGASDVSPDADEAAALLDSLDFSACEPEAELRLREELATLANGGAIAGPSFLPALLSPYSLLDHLPSDAIIVLDETADLTRALDEYVAETATMRIEREARGLLPIGLPPAQANWSDLLPRMDARRVVELARFATTEPVLLGDGGEPGAIVSSVSTTIRPPFGPAPGFGGRVRILAHDLGESMRRHEAVVIVSQQASRLLTLLGEEGLPVRSIDSEAEAPQSGLIQLLKGSLPHGWLLRPGAAPGPEGPGIDPAPMPGPSGLGARSISTLLLLSDAEVFGFVKQRRALRQPGADRSGLIADLTPGDYVVHLEHGIARFAGMVLRDVEGTQREFLELTYAQGDRLFVPVEQADRVARYVGPGDYHPDLTRLGSGDWARARERVRRAVADVAHDLLDLYASRQLLEGHAFSADTPWQQELEASFPYVETPDQVAAIGEVKTDMERPRPMDRLICGDVGFGKTEVAVRAAFKAVMDGYQVAILVPTTVLAQQHYNTFKERLASLPA